jgi:hypothetical protein
MHEAGSFVEGAKIRALRLEVKWFYVKFRLFSGCKMMMQTAGVSAARDLVGSARQCTTWSRTLSCMRPTTGKKNYLKQ